MPLYYARGAAGYSARVDSHGEALDGDAAAALLRRAHAQRVRRNGATSPIARQATRYREDGGNAAKVVAAWKARVRAAWSGVSMRRLDRPPTTMAFGDEMRIEVAVDLNGLRPEDVVVELVLSRGLHATEHERRRHELVADGDAGGEQRFTLSLHPDLCGRLEYRIRIYPYHVLLTHRFELGLMRWL